MFDQQGHVVSRVVSRYLSTTCRATRRANLQIAFQRYRILHARDYPVCACRRYREKHLRHCRAFPLAGKRSRARVSRHVRARVHDEILFSRGIYQSGRSRASRGRAVTWSPLNISASFALYRHVWNRHSPSLFPFLSKSTASLPLSTFIADNADQFQRWELPFRLHSVVFLVSFGTNVGMLVFRDKSLFGEFPSFFSPLFCSALFLSVVFFARVSSRCEFARSLCLACSSFSFTPAA